MINKTWKQKKNEYYEITWDENKKDDEVNGLFKLILNFLIYLSWNMEDLKQNQTKIPWKGINK